MTTPGASIISGALRWFPWRPGSWGADPRRGGGLGCRRGDVLGWQDRQLPDGTVIPPGPPLKCWPDLA